jgi:hypothetical protein
VPIAKHQTIILQLIPVFGFRQEHGDGVGVGKVLWFQGIVLARDEAGGEQAEAGD